MAKVTIQEIAEKLGISRFAVSRALSGGAGVSEETRERVKKMAKKLGYVPRNSKRLNNDGFRTRNILFMIRREHIRDQNFWPMVIAGAESATKKRHLNLIMTVVEPEEEDHGVLPPVFSANNIDGVLAVCDFHPVFLEAMVNQDQPVILVDAEGNGDFDTVVIDDWQGGKIATEYLIGKGHREICFVGDLTMATSFYRRYLGYGYAMSQAGLNVRDELSMGYVEENNSEFLRKLKEIAGSVQGFVCANDQMAINLIAFLTEIGFSVPDDLSVVGFDNITPAIGSKPALTTIHVYKERIGERAVELLEWRRKNPAYPRETISIGVRLIERSSVRERRE